VTCKSLHVGARALTRDNGWHKTLNVLDKFPKSVQPNAHKDLREIWLAPDRATAETAIATFAEKYAPKYDKAVECLIKDRET
jgi:putative transposase